MAAAKKKQKTMITAAEAGEFLVRVLISSYVILLFVLLPICYRDNYFDIGDFKYELFSKLTSGMLLLLLPVLFFYLYTNIRKGSFQKLTIKQIWSAASIVDRFVLFYLLACLLTFILSPYHTWSFFGADISNPAWIGYSGWFMGLRSQLIFVILYFLVSRFFMKGWKYDLLGAILGASAIVFLLGILHRFLIDPLGLYEGIDASYHILFLSTVGQATWYSSYLCTVFPIGLVLFWYCDEKWQRILLGTYTAIGFASLVTQNSDSAYFALAAILFVLFLFSFQSVTYLRRFLEVLLTALLSMRVMGILQLAFSERAVKLEQLSVFLSQNLYIWILIFAIALLYIWLTLAATANSIQIQSLLWIRRAGIIMMAVAIPLGILCIVLTTTGRLPDFLSFFNSIGYFVFNADWGNGRGFTWSYCVKMFSEYPLKFKLLGVGSDCFASYTYEYYAAEVSERWGSSILANGHNEWLNMLLTTGILGFTAYAGIFASAFYSFTKEYKRSIYLLAAAICIASYFFHNLFCYQQVMCTPFIFIILGLGEYIRRSKEN